jgi:hypothetical protein
MSKTIVPMGQLNLPIWGRLHAQAVEEARPVLEPLISLWSEHRLQYGDDTSHGPEVYDIVMPQYLRYILANTLVETSARGGILEAIPELVEAYEMLGIERKKIGKVMPAGPLAEQNRQRAIEHFVSGMEKFLESLSVQR